MPTFRYVEITPVDGKIIATMEASVPNANALEATKALIEARGRKMIVIGPNTPMPEPFEVWWNAETEAFEDIPGDPVVEWNAKYDSLRTQLTDLEASRPAGAEIPVEKSAGG